MNTTYTLITTGLIYMGLTLGIAGPAQAIVNGDNLDKLDDRALATKLEQHTVGFRFKHRDGRERFCTGIAVNPTKVITAAHCFIGHRNVSKSTLFTGPTYARRTASQNIKRSQIEIDEILYNEDPRQNDWAIIHLEESLSLVSHIEVGTYKSDLDILIIGYGANRTQNINDQPRGLGQLRFSMSQGPEMNAESFKFNAGNSGFCLGDSGGPIYQIQDGQLVFVAIAHAASRKKNKICTGGNFAVVPQLH